MQDEAAKTLQTLGLLYETAFGVNRWPEVLDAIADLIGGNGALLFVNDETHSELQVAAMSTRYKPLHAQQYLQSLTTAQELRWIQVLDDAPARTLKTDFDIWPDRAGYDAMPSVRFMRELNLYHRVAVRPCEHGGWQDALTVLYRDDRGGIAAAEAERLRLLLPYLARAIETQRPFKLLQSRFRAVLSMLDRLGMGVLILSRTGSVVACNDEANHILASADGLERVAGVLKVFDARDASRVRNSLERAASAADLQHAEPAEVFTIERRSGREPFVVEILPFRDDGEEMGSRFAGVLMLLIDPEHSEMVAVDALIRSYRLSAAEGLICRMIAQGLPLRDIADSRNVSLTTVKSQARAIYNKTNTRNRGELVRRALSIAPPLLDKLGKRIN